jgi:hypothetical protein
MANVSNEGSLSRAYSMGVSFIRDFNGANAFSKLSRYEMTIVRSLYKALHELQCLQTARHAESDIPPPATLDANTTRSLEKGPE